MDPIAPNSTPTVYSLGQTQSTASDELRALRSFDAYFLGEMLRRSAPEQPSGLFDGGQAGRMYQDHFYQELARIVAESGEFGIASSLEGQLSPNSETTEPEGETEEADSPRLRTSVTSLQEKSE